MGDPARFCRQRVHAGARVVALDEWRQIRTIRRQGEGLAGAARLGAGRGVVGRRVNPSGGYII